MRVKGFEAGNGHANFAGQQTQPVVLVFAADEKFSVDCLKLEV